MAQTENHPDNHGDYITESAQWGPFSEHKNLYYDKANHENFCRLIKGLELFRGGWGRESAKRCFA